MANCTDIFLYDDCKKTGVQAKDALQHAYFDDLDKMAVEALESDIIKQREQEEM